MKKLLCFLMLAATLLVAQVNAQVPVFSEGFESGSLPNGWTIIDADNDGSTWTILGQGHLNNYDGYSMFSTSQGRTPDNWLVTPAITLGTASSLSFWRMRGWNGNNEHYGVFISTTSASDPSAFTLLYEETPERNWGEVTVPLNNYDNQTVYIAFRHFNCTNQYGIMIDDIVVTSTVSAGIINVEPASLYFNDVLLNTSSAGQLVTVNAFNLTDVITVSASSPFEVSTDDTNYTYSVTISDTDHVLYVRYVPNAVGTDSSALMLASGTTSANVMLYGNCIACAIPTNLSVVAVLGTSTVVNWTGSSDNYNLYYKASTDTSWTVIEYVSADSTGYLLTSLTPSTAYTWYVAALCDDGSSMNSDVTGSFTTGCAAYTVPFSQDFQASNSTPQCWNQYTGWANNVFAGGGLTSTGSAWNFWNSHAFGYTHARVNICNSNCNKWLVTPPIDLTGLSIPTLTFDLALTLYNSDASIVIENQPDDKFMVIISTDGGLTWSASDATIWSNDGNGDYVFDQISTAGQEISIPLTNYVDQTVRIAFYGESTIANGDNDLHIDNVTIVNNTSCVNPSDLSATAVTSSSVTLSWTENGNATLWNIEYGPIGYQQGSSTATQIQATSNPFTINNLTIGACDFYVQADCGDAQSLWLGPASCITCTPPDSLTVSNISQTSATLSWVGSSSSYLVEYKTAQDTTWLTTTTPNTSLVLNGLNDNTTYTVNVYGNCTGVLSTAISTTFTTMMLPTSIPFSTDFSTPTEWVFHNGHCANYWTIGELSDTASALFITHNGLNPGYSLSGGSFSVVSVEKLFTVGDAAELEITFDVQVGGESQFDYLKVFFAPASEEYPAATTNVDYANTGYFTYAIDFTDYLQYSEYGSLPYKFNLTEGNTVHVTVVMPNPNSSPNTDTTAKLVFLWRNDNGGGSQPGAIIRNITIEALTCPAPTNLTVSNLTTNSADVSWNAGSTEGDWLLQYKESSDSSWTSIPVTGTPSYSFTDLTIATTYQIQVQAICSNDEQSLWVSTDFTTFCETVSSFPFTEDFEHSGLIPDCWTQEFAYGHHEWGFQAGGHSQGFIHEAHSGSYNAYLFAEGNTEAAITRLVTPLLDLNDMTEAYVTYWHAQQPWVNYQDQLSVYYRSNPNDQWQLLTQHIDAINLWTKDSIALPNLSATYQLAFVGRTSNGYGIVLDDITINGSNTPIIVTDPTVTTTAATNISQTTATLNATITNPDEVTITAKGFEWKLSDGGSYTPIVGSGSGDIFSASLTSLSENTAYTFKAFISYSDTTVYGDEIGFITLPVGIDNLNLASNISLMPNPADHYIELTINSNVEVKEAVVFNAFGQMIQTVELNNNHARIDLSNMASGMYFVRVSGDNATATKKFIKK